jgi:hypothetical protein
VDLSGSGNISAASFFGLILRSQKGRKFSNITNYKTVCLQRLVGKYGPLASVISFVGVFGYLVASPSKSSGTSKKKR